MKKHNIELYYINDKYIEFLKQLGNSSIESNYAMSAHQKPYVGIVLQVNEYLYFAPLSSPKAKYQKMPNNNPTIFKIEKGQAKKLIGVVRLNNMLPAPKSVLTRLEISHIKEVKYKNLVLAQLRILVANEDNIFKKAKTIYDLVVHKQNTFYCQLSNDFSNLEKNCDSYKKMNRK